MASTLKTSPIKKEVFNVTSDCSRLLCPNPTPPNPTQLRNPTPHTSLLCKQGLACDGPEGALYHFDVRDGPEGALMCTKQRKPLSLSLSLSLYVCVCVCVSNYLSATTFQ